MKNKKKSQKFIYKKSRNDSVVTGCYKGGAVYLLVWMRLAVS